MARIIDGEKRALAAQRIRIGEHQTRTLAIGIEGGVDAARVIGSSYRQDEARPTARAYTVAGQKASRKRTRERA